MNYQDPEVLGWVNGIREKKGLQPLKRIPYALRHEGGEIQYPNSCHCPIARAIQGTVWTSGYAFNVNMTPFPGRPLPEPVREWVREFDEQETERGYA